MCFKKDYQANNKRKTTKIGKLEEKMTVSEDIRNVLSNAENKDDRKVDVTEYVTKLDDQSVLWQLQTTLSELRSARPDERSEKSRRYAITITEMEKVLAYFKTFVVDCQD